MVYWGNQEVGNYLFSADVTSNINYLVDGSILWSGAFPKEFASPSIKWESTKMTNIGLDIVMLNNKLKATAEYYIKNTTDILLTVPIPLSTGAANDPLKMPVISEIKVLNLCSDGMTSFLKIGVIH